MPSQDFSPQPTTKESKVLPELTNNTLPEATAAQPTAKLNNSPLTVGAAQEIIYQFFLNQIQNYEPEIVLQKFKNIFIELIAPVEPKLIQGIYTIIDADSQLEFYNLFKRCCYILVNNWIEQRKYQLPQKLLEILSQTNLGEPEANNPLKLLRVWLTNFINSPDYEDLKVSVFKYEKTVEKHWTSRYQPYLLAAQYLDANNTPKERQTARVLSQQLKDKYKFDLAMYTSRSQSAAFKLKKYYNPTLLGDRALRLIKIILLNRGSMSYPNLAKIFLSQTQNITYKQFKQYLIKYLFFYGEKFDSTEFIREKIINYLDICHPESDEKNINNSLRLRTGNYLIECFTVEKSGEPSALFLMFATQMNPLTLAIILLKIILISTYSRTYLEVCFAKLIAYYQERTPAECQWLINFLEICQIALTIYGDNVQYNLINMAENHQQEQSITDLNKCRVFSQQKPFQKKPE